MFVLSLFLFLSACLFDCLFVYSFAGSFVRSSDCSLILHCFFFLFSSLPSFLPFCLSSFLPFFLSSFLPFFLSAFLPYFLPFVPPILTKSRTNLKNTIIFVAVSGWISLTFEAFRSQPYLQKMILAEAACSFSSFRTCFYIVVLILF